MSSLLDSNQVIKSVYNSDIKALRVDIGGATVELPADIATEVDAATGDNIALSNADGTLKVDVDTLEGKNGLDVIVLNQLDATFSGLSTALKVTRQTITDVASKIPTTPLTNRNSMSVRILSNVPLYLGPSTVTALNGYPKYQNEEIILDVKDNSAVELWGVCASGQSCEIAILELA